MRGLVSDAVDLRIVGGCLATAAGDKYRTDIVAMIPAATPSAVVKMSVSMWKPGDLGAADTPRAVNASE